MSDANSQNCQEGGVADANVSPRPIHYTAEEVARTFSAQLAALDFTEELRKLGLGRLQIFKRRTATKHMTALCVALWKLALERSFPDNAGIFFRNYLDTTPMLAGTGKKERFLRNTVLAYVDRLAAKGATDFSAAAEYLAHSLDLPQDDLPSLRLKLSLRIRSIYSFIFDKLI